MIICGARKEWKSVRRLVGKYGIWLIGKEKDEAGFASSVGYLLYGNQVYNLVKCAIVRS